MMNKIYIQICRWFSGLGSWLKKRHSLLWFFGILLVLLLLLIIIGGMVCVFFYCLPDRYDNSFLKSMLRLVSSVPASDAIRVNKHGLTCLAEVVVYFISYIAVLGIVLPVMTNAIKTIGDKFKNGEIHFSFSDHIVILGGRDISVNLIRQLRREKKDEWIEIQTSDSARRLNQRLEMDLDSNELKKVVAIQGSRDSEEDLKNLCIQNASAVYILGEEGESSKDITNLNCLEKIRQICGGKDNKEKICCNVFFENQTTFSIIHFADSKDSLSEIKSKIELRAFNFYEDWAVKVLGAKKFCVRTMDTANTQDKTVSNNEKGYYCPLDREPITKDSEKGVHFVIIGANRIGFAMAVTAAHIAHYPNFITKGIKTKITIIDSNMKEEMLFFKGKYAHLFDLSVWQYRENNEKGWNDYPPHVPEKDFLDIEWEFINGAVQSDEVRQLLAKYCGNEKRLVTLAVCLEDSPKSLAVGLYLPDVVYDKKIPVLFYQEKTGLLLEMAAKSEHYKEIRPFGMTADYTIDWDRKVRMAQRVNYVYDHITEVPVKFSKDEVKKSWDNLSIVKQWSNIYNANTIYTKLRSVGIDVDKSNRELTDEEVGLLAEVEHNRWNIEELMLGFRPTTEEENRKIEKGLKSAGDYKKEFIHNGICPYKDLSNRPGNLEKYDIGLTKALLAIAKE